MDEARSRADAAWREQIEAWEMLLIGQSDEAQARFDAARQIAQSLGF